MQKGKLFIFVCCGAGKLTSYMAEEGIKKGLKEAGLHKSVKTMHGMMADITKWGNDIDILVTSSNYTGKHSFPVVSGVAFVTMDEEGQKVAIAKVVELVKEIQSKQA